MHFVMPFLVRRFILGAFITEFCLDVCLEFQFLISYAISGTCSGHAMLLCGFTPMPPIAMVTLLLQLFFSLSHWIKGPQAETPGASESRMAIG